MKKIYFYLLIAIVFFALLSTLVFIDIPSPSKLISENYNLEVK